MKYSLFGSFTAKDGKRDELAEILIQASELLEKNEDCVHYLVSKSENIDQIWVYETWSNKESHDKALEPENIKALIQTAMPLVQNMGDQTELTLLGGKGL